MQNKKRSRQRAFLLCLRIETATHGRGISGKGYNGHIVSFGVSGMINMCGSLLWNPQKHAFGESGIVAMQHADFVIQLRGAAEFYS